MPDQDFHLSDRQMLLYMDDELSSRDAKHVRSHLRACHECRTRMTEMESAVLDFTHIHRKYQQPVSDISAPRTLLRARLAYLTQRSCKKGLGRFRFALDMRGLMCVCVLAILAVLASRFVYQRAGTRASRASIFDGPLPNPNLTPGSTRQVQLASLCSSDRDDAVRRVPYPLERKIFKEYGMRGVPENNYEVDYLITPGLGGSDNIRNLWPEPHDNTMWNSYVKDQLENHLHRMVCSGKLSLSEAQKDIASNWIAAYKRYFHTNQPLPLSPSSIALSNSTTIADPESHLL